MGRSPRKSSRNETITVNLDIAGMYYRRAIVVPSGASVKDVMEEAQRQNAPGAARIISSSETVGSVEFLDGIRVVHEQGSAISGQDPSRVYPDGTYEYYDDDVEEIGGRLKPRNRVDRPFVLAWQYYVYDEEGRDLSRARAGGSRKIVPYAKSNENGFMLDDGYTIVWRLIAIWLEPTYGDSMKVVMARGRS